MLDDIELPQVQSIRTHEKRMLAEHKPPGMSGSLLQNLGRRPTLILLWGVATGTNALSIIEKLDGKYRAGNPLSFTADIVAQANIEQVIIDNLQVEELAGKPQRYTFVLTLKEYIKPVEPEDISLLDTSILDDALSALDSLTVGLGVIDELSKFIDQLSEINQSLERGGLSALG